MVIAIRPFSPTDVLLVHRLQRSSVPLAIEQALTHPRAPLWVALMAPWPWAGLGVATYVLEDSSHGPPVAGFVQIMRRAHRPEADLLCLAPALTAAAGGEPAAEAIWRHLLAHCCQEAARHGLQRVFASAPGEGPEQGSLRAAGFSLYARETIYRLAATATGSRMAAGFRPQLPQDSWALQRLYARSTPRLVQQAEGATVGEVGSPPLTWWEPHRWHGIVWVPAGEVRGAVQLHLGRTGHWLRVWGVNELSAAELRELLAQGLALAGADRTERHDASLPIYAGARDYEIGLGAALVGLGFAPFTDRARFVKHIVAAVREPVMLPVATLEVRQQEVPVHCEREWS
jgi:hypothetical protein